MIRTKLYACLGLLIGFAWSAGAGGCTGVTAVANPDHCVNNGGDQYCTEKFPDKPWCVTGVDDCALEGDDQTFGCAPADSLPDKCRDACGEIGHEMFDTPLGDDCTEDTAGTGTDSGGGTTTGGPSTATGTTGTESGTSTGTGTETETGSGTSTGTGTEGGTATDTETSGTTGTGTGTSEG